MGAPKIKGPAARDTTQGIGGTLIAVVDSGIDTGHPDVGGKVVAEGNFYNNDPIADDNNGHGTHVAGIAAAGTNNGAGVAGACPGCILASAKALEHDPQTGSAFASFTSVSEAIVASAYSPGVKVINLSLGGDQPSTLDENAVNYASNKGIAVVAAAGNDARSGPNYPAAYANAIAVAGTDFNNGDSDFSSFGSWVDVSASGGEGDNGCRNEDDILSTYPGGYEFLCGTSMATPFVSGVAGWLVSQGRSAPAVRQRMESTATDLGPAGRDELFGHGGLVNAQAAVAVPSEPANTPSRITAWAPRTSTADNTPTIRATMIDEQHYLYKGNIRLYVDGRRVTTFRTIVGERTRITYTTRYLKNGRHSAGIVVTAPNGASAARTWRFAVR